jgi:hypothetical protein
MGRGYFALDGNQVERGKRFNNFNRKGINSLFLIT